MFSTLSEEKLHHLRHTEIVFYKWFPLDKGKILSSGEELTLYHTISTLTTRRDKPVENIMGKGENAGKQHFLLFPQCFLPYQKPHS